MESYYRASKKQVAYISSFYQQLGEFDDTPFVKYSMAKAEKTITTLKRKLEKQQLLNNQTRLL